MHDDNLKPLEAGKKVKGMYDAFETVDKRNERMVKLGLDPNNEVHQAAADALRESEYLSKRGKKTTAKDYGKKLDELTKQALKLSEAIKELKSPGYMNHFESNFRVQYGKTVFMGLQGAEYLLQLLVKAIQSAKESAIEPIDDGYYTPFLNCFVYKLLRNRGMLLLTRYQLKKTVPAEKKVRKILIDYWKDKYSECARETAIMIIQNELRKDPGNRRVAQKAVKKHLDRIVNERIDIESNWLIEILK